MKCNRNDLCKILGVTFPTINGYVEKGMPYIAKPNKEEGVTEWLYETIDVIAWLLGRDEDAERRDADRIAKSRELLASSGLKWLEYVGEVGLVSPIEDFRPYVIEAAVIIKSRLNAMPGRLAQTLAIETDPAVVQRIIKDEVNQILTGMESDFAKIEQVGAEKRAAAREAGIIE